MTLHGVRTLSLVRMFPKKRPALIGYPGLLSGLPWPPFGAGCVHA